MKNCYDDIEELLLGEALAPEAGLHLADPMLVSHYKEYNNRTLWITKDINDSLFIEMKLIIQWNREDEQKEIPVSERKPITCIIDTGGGWLDSAFSFISLISLSKTPVKTVNIGSCMSAGCLMLLSGTLGYRYCMPLSTALLHEGEGTNSGTYSAVQAQNENYKRMMATMKDWVIQHSKIDAKTMKKWSGKETYLYAEDQLKWGIVDHIITDLNEVI